MKLNKFLNPGSAILLFCLILLLLRYGSLNKDLYGLSNENISLSQDLTSFKKLVNDQGDSIAIQDQVIISERLAKKLIADSYEKLKAVKSQTKVVTKIELVEVPVPATSEIEIVEIDTSNFMRVPQSFALINSNFTLNASVDTLGLKINKLYIPNTTTVTCGLEKRGFFRKSQPVVVVNHSNSLLQTSGMSNVVVENRTPWYNTRGFNLAVGFAAGMAASR